MVFNGGPLNYKKDMIVFQPGGGGYSHIKANGNVLLRCVAFLKNSLNTGPIFYNFFFFKSLNVGPIFWLEPKFLGFRMAKTSKITKFVKKWVPFSVKITLKDG